MASYTANISMSIGGVWPNSSNLIQPTGNVQVSLQEAVSANSTNLPFAVSFPVSSLAGVYLSATSACSVYVNQASSGSPSASLTLAAGIPIVWFANGGFSQPMGAAAVNSIYVTSTAANTVTLAAIYG